VTRGSLGLCDTFPDAQIVHIAHNVWPQTGPKQGLGGDTAQVSDPGAYVDDAVPGRRPATTAKGPAATATPPPGLTVLAAMSAADMPRSEAAHSQNVRHCPSWGGGVWVGAGPAAGPCVDGGRPEAGGSR